MFSSTLAFGQATSTHQPGETFTVTVTLEGVDANRIETATVWLRLTEPEVPNDQAGFENGLSSHDPVKDGPNRIKVSFTVKKNTARGEYKLNQIRLSTLGDAPISIMYDSGLPEYRTTIKNPDHFEKPIIKTVNEP